MTSNNIVGEAKNNNIRVLVTAIGTVNGGAVVDELHKYSEDRIYVIGANSTPAYCTVTSKYVDEFYVFPSVLDDTDRYLNFLLEFCIEHMITHIICFIDEEVELLTRNRQLFIDKGIILCLADHSTVFTCHYKDIFSKWVKENLPAVWIKEYTNYSDISNIVFPVFVKPIEGRASLGCQTINSKQEYVQKMEETNRFSGYIVQEKITGDIVGVDVIRNRKYNQLVIVQKKELMRNSNGCGTVVEIIDNKEINEICVSLAEKLDLNGLINVEFFLSESGPKIIEINPRLPAGTSYSCLAGANTVINTLLIAEGKPCEFDKIKIGAKYARRYETYEM